MDNQEYWDKRFIELESLLNKKIKLSEKEIKELSKRVSRKFNREISYWLHKFAENNSLTIKAAKEMLNNEELEDFLYTLDDYIEMGRSLKVNNEWLETMVNMSSKHHITKYAVANTVLRQHVETFISQEFPIIHNAILDTYKESFYRTSYEIGKKVPLDVEMFKPNEKKLDLILKKPWTDDGIEFSERIWGKHRSDLVNKLKKTLENSIIQGDAPEKITKELVKGFGVTEKQAKNLLHTESAYFGEQARKEVFRELGVKKYKYVATLDIKTSSICRKLDGKIFDEKDRKVGVNCPPMHSFCRSTTAPYIKELEGLGERASRDKKGKTVLVPNNMTYEEWYKKYVESDKEYSVKEKKWKNRHTDKKQFEEYKNLGYDGVKTFEDFQRIKYNDTKEWELIKGYAKTVQKGEISPLVKYNNFKKYHNELEDKFIGKKTIDGIEIKRVSYHFTGRSIGTHDWANSDNSKEIMKRLNHKHVPIEDIEKCLTSGTIAKKRSNSVLLELEGGCGVTYNPINNTLIQCNPRR